MVDAALVRAGDTAEITRRTREAVALAASAPTPPKEPDHDRHPHRPGPARRPPRGRLRLRRRRARRGHAAPRPGERRIKTARSFDVWEGGGEYNVARGLRRAFGLRGAIVTALADNEVGRLVEDLMLTGGLDTRWVRWREDDGIGRTVRNGLNFTERGFGVRGAVGVSRPRQHRDRPAPARRRRLGRRVRPRRAVVPHRRHLRRAVGVLRGRRRGGHGRRPPPRHGRLLRPQLPPLALEGHRRRRARAGGEPPPRAVRRRDDRQRGGLHRVARVRGRGRRREPHRPRHVRVPSDDHARGRGVPELPGRRDDAARRADRDGQRLGRDRVVARAGLRGGDAPPRPGDPRPRGRRRLVRVGPRVRAHGARLDPGGRRVRRGARGARDDDPGDTSTASLAEVRKLASGGSARVQR